jgi:hypothetical protein
MKTQIEIALEEIDRSLNCNQWWGKNEAVDALKELRERVLYRTRKQCETQEDGMYKVGGKVLSRAFAETLKKNFGICLTKEEK